MWAINLMRILPKFKCNQKHRIRVTHSSFQNFKTLSWKKSSKTDKAKITFEIIKKYIECYRCSIFEALVACHTSILQFLPYSIQHGTMKVLWSYCTTYELTYLLVPVLDTSYKMTTEPTPLIQILHSLGHKTFSVCL